MTAALVERLRGAEGRRRVLAVWAHPDDESFGPVVTFRRAADAGAALALLTATRGEAGQTKLPDVTKASLAGVREAELLAAATVIGFEQVQILGHPDGGLEQVYHLHQEIAAAMQAFNPHVVVTFGPDGITGHPDHLAVGAATTLAFARLRGAVGTNGPWKLYYVTPEPGSSPPELAPHTPPLPPTTVVQAPEYRATKLAALACHRTQVDNLDALQQEEGSHWLSTDFFFRAFPGTEPGDSPESDILADV